MRRSLRTRRAEVPEGQVDTEIAVLTQLSTISTHIQVVWFDKSNKSWKMGQWAWVPLCSRGQSPPWTSWMFNFRGFTDSPHPHKQETWTQYRLLLSFIGGYVSSYRKFLRQRKICEKIQKNHRQNILQLIQEVHTIVQVKACFKRRYNIGYKRVTSLAFHNKICKLLLFNLWIPWAWHHFA